MIHLLLLLLVLSADASTGKDANFTVTAPERIRPGEAYTFVVAVYGAKNFIYSLEARISSDSTSNVLVEQTFRGLKSTTSVLSLTIPEDVPVLDYTFNFRASGSVLFSGTHAVSVERKSHSIFIQTDKAFYHPGQKVLFRVVATTAELKPYTSPINISIYDHMENRIYRLVNQRNVSGVIKGELKLSDVTPLGRWRIEAKSQSLTQNISFLVSEYVLPKYEVKIILPPYFLVNLNNPLLQKNLTLTVTAFYTFGKPVEGDAVVTLQLGSFSIPIGPGGPGKIQKFVMLNNGKADITLSLDELKYLAPRTDVRLIPSENPRRPLSRPDEVPGLINRDIIIEANVTETATQTILSTSEMLSVRVQRFRIEFLETTSPNFKPGFEFTAYVRLVRIDGSIPDSADIKIFSGFKSLSVLVKLVGSDKTVEKSLSIRLTNTGQGVIQTVSLATTQRIEVYVNFYDELTKSNITAVKYVNPFITRDKKFIHLSVFGSNVIKPSSSIVFKVRTSDSVGMFQGQLIGKGGILKSSTYPLAPNSKETLFTIYVDLAMALRLAPEARVVVFLVTSSGELVADSLSLPVTDYLSNKVSLLFNATSATAGDQVELQVKAFKESFVSLLAVDQSALLLGQSNDLTFAMIDEDMKSYLPRSSANRGFVGGKRRIWNGGDTSFDLLTNAGIFVVTSFFIESIVSINGGIGGDGPFVAKNPSFNADSASVAKIPSIESIPLDTPVSSPDSLPPTGIRKRTNFPETWIWSDVKIGLTGQTKVTYTVPDTMTSWVATAFATSDRAGLGISSIPAKLTVVQPFFIQVSTPYSIVRGEQFALQVTIFNYLEQDLKVDVSLLKSDNFMVQQCVGSSEGKFQNVLVSKYLMVRKDEAVSTYFWIMPTALGQIPIEVRALAKSAADSVVVNVLSKAEGHPRSYSTSSLIKTTNDEPSNPVILAISLPPMESIVPGSVYIEVTLIGDILGTTISNLDKLLQMPHGCGEQNMLNMAPDVYILKYLTAAHQLTDEINDKAIGFISAGYQTQLTFQRRDGSFSAFGDSDLAGSIWLSAFVTKVFSQARNYIPVDDLKIEETFRWMVTLQSSNGSFNEPPGGRVIHTDMQGGSASGISLTAYVVISLLNVKTEVTTVTMQNSITSAVQYLELHYEKYSLNPYVLAIVGYALQLASSSHAQTVLQLLEPLAVREGDLKYWQKETRNAGDLEDIWVSPTPKTQSSDIEMTSYVLLTYAALNDLDNALPIAKWLIRQRNAQGGFLSTQDTVIGLEALAVFASLIHVSSDGDLTVQVSQDSNDEIFRFSPITRDNALTLQSYEISSASSMVTFLASGEGLAVVQLNVRYNLRVNTTNQNLIQSLSVSTEKERLVVKVCLRWESSEQTGMVLTEFHLLTGYSIVGDYRKDLASQIGPVFKKVDFHGDYLAIYLDELNAKNTCFNMITTPNTYVGSVKPALVKTYRYYEPNVVVSDFYSPVPSKDAVNACSRF